MDKWSIMPSRTHPAIEIAETYLRRLLDSGQRFPGMKVIARQVGVSLVSVWKAVQRMKTAGLVTARPRAGIRPVKERSARAEMAPAGKSDAGPRMKARRIATCIRSDVLRASLPSGEAFPSYKELCRRYQCDYRTARKAVDMVERETGAGLRSMGASSRRETVVLVAWGAG